MMEIVGDLSAQQWGLFTTAQARGAGVDAPWLRRLTVHGAIVRVRHGVYASMSTPLTPITALQAEWLALEPETLVLDRLADFTPDRDATVSHTSAAEAWGIGDLWPQGNHFTVAQRRRSRQSDVAFHKAALTAGEWVLHPALGLPVTTVSRTIADLAFQGHEPQHLREMIADAATAGLTTEAELMAALQGAETALGFPEGDTRALVDFVQDGFPDVRELARINERIDKLFAQVIGAQAQQIALNLNRQMEEALAPLHRQVERLSEDWNRQIDAAGLEARLTKQIDSTLQRVDFPEMKALSEANSEVDREQNQS